MMTLSTLEKLNVESRQRDRNGERSTTLAPTAAPGLSGERAERQGDEVNGRRGASVRRLLLDAAIRLFCRNGIGVTGIDAIVAEAGLARMTLYNHFCSKDGLVAAALEHEGAAWRAWFFAGLAQMDRGPRQRLLGVFDLLAEWFERDDYFGCALMNAVLEARNQDPVLLAITVAHKKPVLEQLQALAAAAGARHPESLAQQIDLLMNGAIVKAVFSREAHPAMEAKRVAEALLETAIDPKAVSLVAKAIN